MALQNRALGTVESSSRVLVDAQRLDLVALRGDELFLAQQHIEGRGFPVLEADALGPQLLGCGNPRPLRRLDAFVGGLEISHCIADVENDVLLGALGLRVGAAKLELAPLEVVVCGVVPDRD